MRLLCVCLCETFVFVKDFSGNTLPRILKFDTNIDYDLLYCVREKQHPNVYHFLYLYIFLSLQYFVSQISQLLSVPVFKLCIHLQRVKVYCVQEDHDAGIYFAFFFHFSFSISHSDVCIEKIGVKDFSRTTALRNLKFVTNIG